MVSESKLSTFSIEELQTFREKVLHSSSKEELLEVLDRTIKKKEEQLTKCMNSQLLVEYFNIDQDYIEILHRNGINNLAQLRNIKEEDLWSLQGMTQGGFRQISWARDFFDMTPIERIKPAKRNSMTVAKVIVKHANECSKKHPNV